MAYDANASKLVPGDCVVFDNDDRHGWAKPLRVGIITRGADGLYGIVSTNSRKGRAADRLKSLIPDPEGQLFNCAASNTCLDYDVDVYACNTAKAMAQTRAKLNRSDAVARWGGDGDPKKSGFYQPWNLGCEKWCGEKFEYVRRDKIERWTKENSDALRLTRGDYLKGIAIALLWTVGVLCGIPCVVIGGIVGLYCCIVCCCKSDDVATCILELILCSSCKRALCQADSPTEQREKEKEAMRAEEEGAPLLSKST